MPYRTTSFCYSSGWFFLGIITGLVGVGGGFLLVPALTHLASLPVHAAIGTSLFIITLQS
ncbi:hypothetical protein BMR07_13070 [Methylococcaceae bacterium CS1]|nr:hypothetical protein BMR07_13070 [Methylococcaceae bacterium CS1]